MRHVRDNSEVLKDSIQRGTNKSCKCTFQVASSVALAWEGGRIHEMRGDARRLLLSRMVIDHRVLANDPFRLTENSAQREISGHLLGERAVGMAEVGELLSRRRLEPATSHGFKNNTKSWEYPMKAAVLHEVNKPLVIEDVSLPKPGPREVLIRTSVAGLCHSDLHFMEGLYPHPLPAVLGHEFAGIVEQVGSDVTYVKPGDHVVTCLSVFCGTCDNCTTGRPVLCTDTSVKMLPGASNRLSWARPEKLNQFLNLSSFAEQMLVHENAIVKIRKDMPLELAALIGCGVITGYGAVVNTAKVAPGETVVVIGCGGVGMAAINGAEIAGAGRIIAVDTNPAKLQLATKLGATDIVDPRNGDVVQQVRDLTNGGVHHSFEVLGRKETAEQAFAMLAPGGTATIVGMIPFGQKIELHGFDFLRERKIQGSSMGSNHFRVDMPRLIEFYMRGKLHLEDWISARLKLSEINEGFAAMKAGKTVRSVIMFDA